MKRRREETHKLAMLVRLLARRRLAIECDRIPYRFEPVSSSRLRNWFLAEVSAYLRLAQPLGLPTHLQAEPTNRCNLRCVVCPTTTGELTRPRGAMAPDSFEKLMDEIGDRLLLVLLWEWGEPFLNQDILRLVSSAKGHGVKVATSTNGHFIQDSTKAREIVQSGLDTLVFAVDGTSPDTYRVYRQGGQFERVLDGVRVVVEAKKALGSTTPFVVLQFVVMRHNQAQIAQAADLARGLGVDVLSLRTANAYDSEFESAIVPDDPRYRQFEYVEGTGERKRKPNRCKRFWNMPAVQWNGTVSHCEFDINGAYALGNAFQSSLSSVWLGDEYRRARSAFARRQPITDPCHNCMYNYGSVHDIVAEAKPLSAAARLAGVR